MATNIAETSVTIPGIRYVIDSGVGKARIYDAEAGIESLDIVKTSKAQALQRRLAVKEFIWAYMDLYIYICFAF